MNQVKVTHKGVVIYYNESQNRWDVDDDENGITLKRSSLNEAKKGVEAALRRTESGLYKRFKAWKEGRGWGRGPFELVTVTSVIDSEYSTHVQAWITYPAKGKGRPQREKTYLSGLYEDTPENSEVISKIVDVDEKLGKLNGERSELTEKLTLVKVEEDEDGDG